MIWNYFNTILSMIDDKKNYFTPIKMTNENIPNRIDTELDDKNGHKLENPRIENWMKFVGKFISNVTK